jgi:phage/plasmid-like protein (TIGR03299 family)
LVLVRDLLHHHISSLTKETPILINRRKQQMSTETQQWLNQNVLVGMTDKRGTAWHYKASEQGTEPNHYTGQIPIEDVRRRLFNWQATKEPMFVIGADAYQRRVPNRVAIVRDDTWDVLGVVSPTYEPHQYDEWLLRSVGNILDDSLVIGSAGLLKNGAVAWVQIEMPDNYKVADVEFRPNLLATTSFNGSIATTYKRTVTVVVCDNTRNSALREHGQEISIRHTSKSGLRLGDARAALNIVHTMADEFTQEITALLAMKVTDQQFQKFVNIHVPLNDEESKQAVSRAENVRFEFQNLWQNDVRVAPWRGTGFGVLQAVNTHRQHMRPTRGDTVLVERTMIDSLTGKTELADRKATQLLYSVLN